MRATKALVAFLAAATLAGCGELLEQNAPSRVLEEDLLVPTNAKLLVDGARAAFGCAYQAYITGTGLLSDEMEDNQLAAAGWDYDRRSVVPVLGTTYAEGICETTQLFGVYRPLQVARFQADFAKKTVEGFPDDEVANKSTLLATAALFAGYGYVLLGEGFCTSAISAPDEILTTGGSAELSSDDMFTVAEAKFTEAIALGTAAAQPNLVNAALVGRARARLNLENLAGARADAALVPAGFSYTIPYNAATSYSQNLLYRRQRDFLLYGIAPAFRNLTFGGVVDPRVLVDSTGLRGADAVSQVWAARKYTAQNSPIVLAGYKEAQLIIAEIDGGQAAVDIINALHTAAGLPPFSSSDPTAILNQVIQERDRELFLEGHRFWTIRRLNLPLNPAAGTTYPIKGGSYGDTRCLPMPDIERTTNPKLRGT